MDYSKPIIDHLKKLGRWNVIYKPWVKRACIALMQVELMEKEIDEKGSIQTFDNKTTNITGAVTAHKYWFSVFVTASGKLGLSPGDIHKMKWDKVEKPLNGKSKRLIK